MEMKYYHYLVMKTTELYRKRYRRCITHTIKPYYLQAQRDLERNWNVKVSMTDMEYNRFAMEVRGELKRRMNQL